MNSSSSFVYHPTPVRAREHQKYLRSCSSLSSAAKSGSRLPELSGLDDDRLADLTCWLGGGSRGAGGGLGGDLAALSTVRSPC